VIERVGRLTDIEIIDPESMIRPEA